MDYEKAKALYLADLHTNGASDCTLTTYGSVLKYYAAHCEQEWVEISTPAAVAS